LDAAEESYRRLSALPGKQYEALHALFLFHHGKPERAISELRELAGRNADDRLSRTRLIAAYVESGNAVEGQKLLAEALHRNPKDTDGLMQRSALHFRGGDTVEAQRDLQQVLQFQSDNAEAHPAMARTYKAQGQLQSERREVIDALRFRGDLLQARVALARNYLNTNQAKSALQPGRSGIWVCGDRAGRARPETGPARRCAQAPGKRHHAATTECRRIASVGGDREGVRES
jgi:predicted Zn-dependent protease